MTNKYITPLLISLLLIFFPTCSSVRLSKGENIKNFELTDEHPVVHINAEIWGIHMFDEIPLFSGAYIKVGRTKIFSSTTTIQNVMTIIENKAKEIGATRIIDINSTSISSWQSVTLIFWYKEIQISATAVKDPESAKDKKLPGIIL